VGKSKKKKERVLVRFERHGDMVEAVGKNGRVLVAFPASTVQDVMKGRARVYGYVCAGDGGLVVLGEAKNQKQGW